MFCFPPSPGGYRYGAAVDLDFSFAFQPIIDIRTQSVYSYEALVRGRQNEPAATILSRLNDANRHCFDQACCVGAIELAARLGIASNVNINFSPNAVCASETFIGTTCAAMLRTGFPLDRIVFEAVESDRLVDSRRLVAAMREYKRLGFTTAIDDFGSGFRDLEVLAEFQPDLLKVDMNLLRDINADRVRQAILRGIIGICRDLKIRVLAEGVETYDEFAWLREVGVELYQGFYFARPAFELAEPIDASALGRTRRVGLA